MITTVIPTIGRDTLWSRAVPSIQAQTVKDWRCIIVGDGVDIPPFDDERIRVLRIEAPDYPEEPIAKWRVAGVRAFAHGLDHVDTNWFSYLADDDQYMPMHHDVLEAAGGKVDVVYGVSESVGRANMYGQQWPPSHRDICQGAYIMRTDTGHRPREDAPGTWDGDWWYRAIESGMKFGHIGHVVHRSYISDEHFRFHRGVA